MSFPKRSRFSGNKFGSVKVDRPGGLSFSSKLEAALYDHIWLLEKAGEIRLVQMQSHCYLTDARIHCIPDYKILNLQTNEYEWWEAKGFSTDRFLMIKKLWEYYGEGRLKIFKGTYKSLFLAEEIVPKKAKQMYLSECRESAQENPSKKDFGRK